MAEFKADKYIFELDAAIESYEAKMKRAGQLADELGGRIQAANQQVSTSTGEIVRAMDGYTRVIWDASIRGGRWRDVMTGQTVAAKDVVRVTKDMGVVIEGIGDSSKKAEEGISRFMGPQWIARGIAMGIGWSLMQQGINLVGGAVKDLIMAGVELESWMVSVEHISTRTGKNFGTVMEMVNRQTDSFTSKASIMATTSRLLMTSLSTEQIEKLIVAFKEGSVAMGYQADEQLPLLARGFKQLNANILDNIGYERKLNQLWSETAKQLGVSAASLTVAQREQALYNDIIRNAAVNQGLLAKQLETAKGQVNSITAEWKKLAETVSETGPIKAAGGAIAGFLASIRERIEAAQVLGAQRTERIAMEFGIGSKEWQKLMEEVEKIKNKEVEEIKVSSEALDARVESTQSVVDLKNALEDNIDTLDEYNQTIEENNKQIKLNDREIRSISFEIRDYQNKLSDVNDEMTEWIDKQRESERVISDLERALQRKKEALTPEQYAETEEKLRGIRTELEQARREEESAEERVATRRVEPKIWRRYQQEAAEAHQKVIDLTNEEANLTNTLTGEISDLEGQLSTERDRYQEITEHVNELNSEKERLTSIIETLRDRMDTLSEETYNLTIKNEDLQEEIETELTPTIETLTKKLEAERVKIREVYDELKQLSEAPDVYKTVTVTTKRVTEYITTGTTTTTTTTQRRQAGGNIPITGIYHLEAGERVLSPMKTREIEREGMRMQVTINAGMRPMRDVFAEIEQLAKEKTSTYTGGVFR